MRKPNGEGGVKSTVPSNGLDMGCDREWMRDRLHLDMGRLFAIYGGKLEEDNI